MFIPNIIHGTKLYFFVSGDVRVKWGGVGCRDRGGG